MRPAKSKITEVDILAACNQLQQAAFICMGKWEGCSSDGDIEILIELEDVSSFLRKTVIDFVKQRRKDLM